MSSPNNNLQERTPESRVARADKEIAGVLALSANDTPQTPLGERIGALQWELDARHEKAAALGEPVMRVGAVGEARRVMTPRQEIAETAALVDRATARVPMAVVARESLHERLGIPPDARDMSTEALRAEQRTLHETMKPMLERYVAAEDGPAKMAVLNEMGAGPSRYQSLTNALADRTSAELRNARIEKALTPASQQAGLGF